ncbi:hypothetical protein AVEN_180253-1 [Araneus ventricosus]|uniref:Uncharacterized protein n=1 Tax=Araneus ventricosus TaxID=182803 RepID=A0A4Y2FLY2_ARAVE|nr:hypothetical protein AVEN_180253-1 [Araneus ventricosus]
MSPMANFDRGILPEFSNHKSYAGSSKYTANLLIAGPHPLLTVIYPMHFNSAGATFVNVILMTTMCGWLGVCGLSEKRSTLFSWENVLAGRGKRHSTHICLIANI